MKKCIDGFTTINLHRNSSRKFAITSTARHSMHHTIRLKTPPTAGFCWTIKFALKPLNRVNLKALRLHRDCIRLCWVHRHDDTTRCFNLFTKTDNNDDDDDAFLNKFYYVASKGKILRARTKKERKFSLTSFQLASTLFLQFEQFELMQRLDCARFSASAGAVSMAAADVDGS